MIPDDPNNPQVDPRVALAAERTALAWFRTGIALMGFGFVVARFGIFLRELAAVNAPAAAAPVEASTIGIFIVGAGVVVNLVASFRHHRMIRQLTTAGHFRVSPRGPVALGVATGVGGLVLVAVLMSALIR
jgi:putative membrane protein